jgi:hypothetical protein
MKLVSQFQAEVPHPLGHQLPALLSPGRVAAPSVGIDLLVFIEERRLKSATMEVQLDHIAGGEGVLRQVREKQFVDHPCAGDPNRTLLLPGGMGSHDHAAGHPLGSHRDLGAIVQTAHQLAFGTLLELIRGQVQARLNQRMIEQAIGFVAGHKREASHIGQHGSRAVLPIEPQQRAFWWEVVGCQIPANGGETLAQFLS